MTDDLYETRVKPSESVVILVAMAARMDETLHRSVRQCRKRRITRKGCKIRQKIVLTTNIKPWVGFLNPPLCWSPCQRGGQIVSPLRQRLV